MEKGDWKKSYTWISISIFLILLPIGIITSNNFKKEYKQKILSAKDFTSGKIVRFFTDRYSTKLVYVFYYKNKEYSSAIGTNLEPYMQKKVINTYWPVILSKDDPEVNYILIDVIDFKRFNLRKPDTLLTTY